MAAGTSYNYSQRGDMVINRRGKTTVRHSPTNYRKFRLHKGFDTHITFFIKDEETGPLYLHDISITAQIATVPDRIDGRNDHTIVLTKVLENVETFEGQTLLRIRANEIANLDAGYYQLILSYQNQRGEKHALYMDQNYRVEYTVEVFDDVLPTSVESVTIDPDEFLQQPGTIDLDDGFDSAGDPITTTFTESVSSAFYGGAGDTPWGLHTISIHGTEFEGRVYVQASLAANPTDNDWFLINLNPNTGDHFANYKERNLGDEVEDTDMFGHGGYDHIDAYIFEGNLLWVRFSILTPVGKQGTVDKILYRH